METLRMVESSVTVRRVPTRHRTPPIVAGTAGHRATTGALLVSPGSVDDIR
jgi:hypothetical protein